MESTTDSVSVLPTMSPPSVGWPVFFQIAFGVLAGAVVLVTLLGNFSVLCAFARTPRLRTYANLYIVGLATADLILGTVVTPLHGAYWMLGYWPFGDISCFVIHKMIGSSTFLTTYLATLVIALDRYFSVAYPLKHLNYRTTKFALSVIFLTYAIPMVLWWPFFFYWRFGYDGDFSVPLAYCYPLYVSNIYATVTVIFIQSWVPIVLMVIMYVKVYRIAQVATASKRLRKIRERVMSHATTSKSCDVATSEVDLQPRQSVIEINEAFEFEEKSPGDSDDCDCKVQALKIQVNVRKTAKPDSESGFEDIASDIQQVASRNKKKHGNRALRTLTPIFISMMMSGLPWALIALVYVICPTCLPRIVNETAVFLTRSYGAMNPFCYAIANPLYRQSFLMIVCSRKKQKP